MINTDNVPSNTSAHIQDLPLDKKQPFSNEVIDLRFYFSIINKNKWRIGFLAIAVAIFAAVVALNITSTYKATATLLIEADQVKAVSFDDMYGLDSNRKEYYLTQFEIIKSRKIAEVVVQRLNLKEHRDFIPKPSIIRNFIDEVKSEIPFIPKKTPSVLTIEEEENIKLQLLVGNFLQRLTVSPVRNTQLVKVSFESSDPKLAALVANTVGETYIEQNLTSQMDMTSKAAGWLTTRLFDLRIRLDDSEKRLQEYRESENLIDTSGVLGLVSNELEQTSRQLGVARLERNKLLGIVKVINEYGRDNIELLGTISEITSQNVIQNVKKSLINVELKVSELREVFGPKHPKMIAAEAELSTVKANLNNQIKRLVRGVEKELASSEQNVQSLEAELVRIKAKYQNVTSKEYEYKKLSREVETNRKIYDTFFSRSKETEVTSDFNSAVARFTDRAFKPSSPIKPNKPLIVILAFVATMGLGIVVAFVVESLNDTFKTAGDVENKLSQRMLGLLPLVNFKRKEGFSLYYFFEDKGKKFAESVRTLRTSFVLTQVEKETKIIEVTSSVPGEGKTTTAINLAFGLAQVERTIIIDADMRKPSICKRFGIPPYNPGLANIINGTESFIDCIYKDDTSGLSVLTCGQYSSNPLELLSSSKFSALLEEIKQSYDRIIIDTPPIQSVSDSLIIAQYADAVIYVVKSDDTRIGVAQDGIGRLIRSNAKVAGVVLNQVDTSKAAQSESYHGYYSHQSYGEMPTEPDTKKS